MKILFLVLFKQDEILRGTATDDDDVFIKATITGIPNSTTLTNDGSLYTEGETVGVTGGGTGAIINVDAIGRGSLTNFYVDNGGSGYEIGDDIVFDNTGSGGGSARAKVSVVNGGFTQEESTSTEEDHLVLEDETTRSDPYTGNKIVQEAGTGVGDITDIRIIDSGSNYLSLPIVTADDTNGSDASIFCYGSEIGRIQGLKIVESGAEYQQSASPPTLTLRSKILVLGKSGDFSTSETVTGTGTDSSSITATVVSFDSDRNILTLSGATGTFLSSSTITGNTSGATATVKITDPATATATVAATANTAGSFLNEDGHVSETTMRIQDSLYYQDFSYVIKVGRTINDWRDSFKKTMHSAGFYFTGQVNIQSQVNARLRSFTTVNSGIDFDGVQLVLNTLFSTIFGRRLGTLTDGTTLRANPELGVDPDFSDSTITPLNKNTRDLTLTQIITLQLQSKPRITVRGTETKYGYAVAAPRMKSLYLNSVDQAFTSVYGGGHPNVQTGAGGGDSVVRSYVQPMQMLNWANHRIVGTKITGTDGSVAQIQDLANDNLKTYIAYPTEITVSYS
jgi:hypothetical protein